MRRKPFSVVLFDEVEKAHPDIFNSLLQVLEEGRLTDAQGRVVDFKNTVIIMTTNLGSRDVSKGQTLGFAPDNDDESAYERMKAKVQQELKQHFRPEFLNRIDDVIVFHQLTENEIIQIVDLMIDSLEKRLEEQDMAIELTPAAKALLAHRGYDSSLGARPLRRTIQRDIEDPLSEKMLFGDMKPGSIVLVDVATDDGEEPFTFTAMPKAELPGHRLRWRRPAAPRASRSPADRRHGMSGPLIPGMREFDRPRSGWPRWLTGLVVGTLVVVALVVLAGFAGGVGPLKVLGQSTVAARGRRLPGDRRRPGHRGRRDAAPVRAVPGRRHRRGRLRAQQPGGGRDERDARTRDQLHGDDDRR